jgi:RimJ/RimL family protein N-acetyltransferase
MLSVRNLTAEEIRGFGYNEPNTINWGVILNGEPVAYFSAEPEHDGRLEVHVTAKRHKLHPRLIRQYAEQLGNRLLELGAKGLIARVALDNRASIAAAKAAGFDEESRDNEFVVMVKNEQT